MPSGNGHKKLKPCAVEGCPELTFNTKCGKHKQPHHHGSRDRRVTGRRWMTLRRSILRDEPLCRLRLEGCEHFASEVDHILPLSLGGHATDRDNLQPVCHACHVRKTQFDVGNASAM